MPFAWGKVLLVLVLVPPSSIASLLATAWERRAPLRQSGDTDSYRWVNHAGDGCDGLSVDWFAGLVILGLHRALPPAELEHWVGALGAQPQVRTLYVKQRPKTAQRVAQNVTEAAPEIPALGSPVEEVWTNERALRFSIRPAQGLSVGLYLDARDARAWVERESRGARVLNLFAYTGGFGLAAARGGANRVVNIDVSRRVLDWGKRNADKNSLSKTPIEYLARDSFEALKQLDRRDERFELVVVDPPSFSSSRNGVFSADKHYPQLAEAAARVTASDGSLFLLCNQGSMTMPSFEKKVREGVERAGRQVRRVERAGASAVDFPAPSGQEGPLKVLRVSLAAERGTPGT